MIRGIESSGCDRTIAKEAHDGVTSNDYGLANTGSLVGDQTDIMQRLASSLSWIHIAIVATGNILADMPSLMTKMTPKESGYIAFITGPSRTADIERVLTIGVHGPERLVIVAVDEMGGMKLMSHGATIQDIHAAIRQSGRKLKPYRELDRPFF
jgi:L-lactate utilization protein LutC